MWHIQTNQSMQVGSHNAPVREVAWLNEINCLASGSWDKTIKYWDTRSPNPQGTVNLPERLYCMDAKGYLLVAGCASKKMLVFDVRKPLNPVKQHDSLLDLQTRCVSLFPNLKGYAYGSIEGRVRIEYLEPKDESNSFAFKCHRVEEGGVSMLYPVNSIGFNTRYGTFATAGGDGNFVAWDKDNKQRLKNFQRLETSITKCAFNRDTTIFAYVMSYDWHKGFNCTEKDIPSQIYLKAVTDDMIRPKPK